VTIITASFDKSQGAYSIAIATLINTIAVKKLQYRQLFTSENCYTLVAMFTGRYKTQAIMKKILCPVDFSNAAQNAIAYAAKLSKATGAILKLVNVQPSHAVISEYDNELAVEAISERLEELGEDARRFLKISCETEVIQSPSLLSDAIVRSSAGSDLIVMGTHGVESLMEFFRGSNTYHAIRRSKVPVMLIPEDCIYSEIKNVVYAYDYLGERKLPIRQVQSFVKNLSCELIVLQVNEEAVSEEVNEEMKELQYIISEDWKDESTSIRFDSIRSSEIAPALNSYINRNESDVLALCTSHRNFIEDMFHKSVIKTISEIANYPVLVFHE
jgi:nucleotide-binding universal stress UspA family protein